MDTFRDDKDIFSCPICGYVTDAPNELEIHVNNHFGDESDASTNLTKLPVSQEVHLNSASHSTHTHKDEDRYTKQRANDIHASGQEPLCPVCNISIHDEAKLEDHVNAHFSEANNEEVVKNSFRGKRVHGSNKSGSLQEHLCPICSISIYDVARLEEHVNAHFSEDNILLANNQEVVKNNSKGKQIQNLRKSSSIPKLWKDDLESCTAGVAEKITMFYASSCSPNLKHVVCNACSHFSTHGMTDEGFGCGYRNLQMIFSSLLKDPKLQSIFEGQLIIPSVNRIQMLLETAWREGFDPTGAQQLGMRVLNSRKWIGTTEIFTILSYIRIRCHIYDFCQKLSGPVSHPELGKLIRNYFESGMSTKHPLYLQYQGHSIVVIGFEEKSLKINLLVLDPGLSKHRMERTLRTMGSEQLRYGSKCIPQSISVPLSDFKRNQYQLVMVLDLMENDEEWHACKVVTSTKVS